MIAVVSEPEEPKTPVSAKASGRSDEFDYLRQFGTTTVVAALVIACAALVMEGGDPPLPLIGGCLMGALVGVGLRIEAAIRSRTPS
ncbi:hypothetical protein ACIBKY_26800 [Nonomuraea sp. NPDC050394]|uniref:hypothetical protein n=1 Tax=Nonomuraea sp. NPDC050394 TaxID=3364363 RepID=UPI00379253BC